MKIEIQIKRQLNASSKAYFQTFHYEGDGCISVANYLRELNQSQAKEDPIAWQCGCMEKKCGACAMLINEYPRLACSSILKDVEKNGKIILAPFRKFPLIKDLIVDRSSMFDSLKEMKIWLEEKKSVQNDLDLQASVANCLACGCCLEVCPNFMSQNKFVGAFAMMQMFKSLEQNENDEHVLEMKKAYSKRFFNYCGQSFSCQDVCPKKLSLDQIQARINGKI